MMMDTETKVNRMRAHGILKAHSPCCLCQNFFCSKVEELFQYIQMLHIPPLLSVGIYSLSNVNTSTVDMNVKKTRLGFSSSELILVHMPPY